MHNYISTNKAVKDANIRPFQIFAEGLYIGKEMDVNEQETVNKSVFPRGGMLIVSYQSSFFKFSVKSLFV